MFYLACTRFNTKTYDENISYRKNYNEIVIYGSTLKIRDIYTSGSLIFVAEMNNDNNKIEGIGLIRNLLFYDKKYKIYENNEYNRYIYKGSYWLSRSQINEFNPEIIEIFDNILFKGKSHLKCRIGITVISEKLFIHWNYELRILKNMVKELFLNYFNYKVDDDFEKIQEQKEEEDYFEIIPKKRKRKEVK